ncbi:MAG TPA: EAL domain-containing protein [Rhodocyclaceae bacterium]
MKLQVKIWLGAGAVIGSIMAVDLYLGYRSIEADVRASLDGEARIVRAMLMATRRVYHQQFIDSGLPVTDKTVGFLPAHALSRISAEFPNWIKSGLRFNNVSDRPRNPHNQADADELAAMDWFRANPKAADHISEIRSAGGTEYYHFTAPIWIEPYCLRCHGERAKAPPSISSAYDAAYGYKLGELRGVMSIKLPMDELRAEARAAWWQRFGIRGGGYLLLLLLLGSLMQRLVVRPLRHLQGVAQQLGEGTLTARATVTTHDEVALLAASFNEMADAIARRDAHVAQLNRIYAALSATNQTIVRVDNELELLCSICSIAVEYGGMRLAWVGRRDRASERIVVAECCGSGLAYLDGLSISLDPADEDCRGPIASAWLSQHPVIVQDFFAAESTRHWHERARAFQWGSSAAFPIIRGGEVFWILSLYHAEKNAFDDKMVGLLGEMATDIGFALDKIDLMAERTRIEAALRENEEKYRNVLETSQDGFWLADRAGRLLEVNDGYVAFSGYTREELLTMKIAALEADVQPAELAARLERIAQDGSGLFEARHRTKDGAIKAVEISATFDPRHDACFSMFVRDLSQRNEAEERIQRLAHFDTLTGLPNHKRFAEMAQQAIAQALSGGAALGLMFIDIDRFKNINDTLGHRIGDMLLVDLAQRLQQVLRPEDTLSRLGGDEFLLLLPHATAESAAHMAEQLSAAVAQSVVLDGHELLVTSTIGIALYPADGEDFETLLRKADTAINRAKQDGRSSYRFFTSEMQQLSARSLQLEAELRRALERRQLLLHYQPQIDLASGAVVGVEALIRWQHPELGLISPVEFIPIAESTGLILPIGEWVMQTALGQLRAWNEAGLPLGLVAVNLSALQFRQDKLPQTVARILAEAGLPATCLELELTESIAMEDPASAVVMMDALHSQGVRISIDDFGTGYSSLNYLKRFHIDKLKVDQSFVRDLASDPEGVAIVQAIVNLAATLNFKTIAEGCETPEQLAILKACGCEEIQGYLFSRPLPPEALAAWLRAWRPEQATG